jgi:hypothetical protein
MRHFAVFLSDNPGIFVEDDGPQQGAIVTGVSNGDEPPGASYFAKACTEFALGSPRISTVLPYFEGFDSVGWRTASVGPYVFWTNRETNSFSPES